MRSDVKNLAKYGQESAYWCRMNKDNCVRRLYNPKCPYNELKTENNNGK